MLNVQWKSCYNTSPGYFSDTAKFAQCAKITKFLKQIFRRNQITNQAVVKIQIRGCSLTNQAIIKVYNKILCLHKSSNCKS